MSGRKVYRLTSDVHNPRGDGRTKNDWRYTKVWKKGAEFVIRDRKPGDEWPPSMIKVGNSYAVNDPTQLGAVLACGVEVPESPLALLTHLEVTQYHARPFYQYLIEMGHLSMEDFERLWERWMDLPEPV